MLYPAQVVCTRVTGGSSPSDSNGRTLNVRPSQGFPRPERLGAGKEPTIVAGVYYSKADEDHPVFHVYATCSEGEKIEPDNRKWELIERRLCEACAQMGDLRK